jgi:hypothetical protein
MKGVWLWLVLCIGGIGYGVVWEVVRGFFINGVSRFPLANYAFKEGIRPPIICSILMSTIHLRYVLLLPRKGCWSLDWTQHNSIPNFFLSLDLFCQKGVSSYLLFVSIASTICDFWSEEKVAGVLDCNPQNTPKFKFLSLLHVLNYFVKMGVASYLLWASTNVCAGQSN